MKFECIEAAPTSVFEAGNIYEVDEGHLTLRTNLYAFDLDKGDWYTERNQWIWRIGTARLRLIPWELRPGDYVEITTQWPTAYRTAAPIGMADTRGQFFEVDTVDDATVGLCGLPWRYAMFAVRPTGKRAEPRVLDFARTAEELESLLISSL